MSRAALLFALAALAFSGCGAAPGPVTPPTEGGKYVIHLTEASMIQPANAKVPLNATVVFVDDGNVHDVTCCQTGSDVQKDDGSWSSDLPPPAGLGHKMNPGDRFEHTFGTAGVFRYHCRIHASTGMVATLTVG